MNSILWLATGALAGALITATLMAWQWRRWQRKHTEQLETSMQSHNLELQIALDELAEKNRLLEQQNMLDTQPAGKNHLRSGFCGYRPF